MRAFLLALLLGSSAGPALADDFLEEPKALCSYFASLGMKAQYQWGPVPQGGAFLCQYADEFGGNTAFVRGARVYVEPASENVGMGLSIQGFSLVRAEAIDTLQDFVRAVYEAQERTLPLALFDTFDKLEEATTQDGGLTVSSTGPELWEAQRVVGLSWQRTASEDQLATLNQSLTPKEAAHRERVESQLQSRCRESVEESGYSDDVDALEMSSEQLSASRFRVGFSGPEGRFDCQVCDDTDPEINCGTMGVRLSFTDPDGNQLNLPAELDRKCVYSLQKEVSRARDGSFIDHELVQRISTREIQNETRYVFEHELDGRNYRCVIRKKDMSYRVEERVGEDDWRALVGGIML